MCGIAGFAHFAATRGEEALREIATRMAQTIHHRGPDDAGAWADPAAGVGFGHRRLSIVDLSPAGHQPMVSANERYIIIYNGEVYNHGELRAELEAGGARFRGHSDTETILEAWSEWGPERTLSRLNGMFAFAIWDRKQRTLFLARDRLGIKPLYWGRLGEGVFFGSELKALRAHPDFRAAIDRDALASFMRHNYIPSPHSIYRGVHKLEPGYLLEAREGRAPVERRFWDLREVAREGLRLRVTQVPEHGETLVPADDLTCALVDDDRLQTTERLDAQLEFLEGGIARFEIHARVVRGRFEFVNRDLLQYHCVPPEVRSTFVSLKESCHRELQKSVLLS